MFAKIREILDDGDAFVCVLIDEVESLTARSRFTYDLGELYL